MIKDILKVILFMATTILIITDVVTILILHNASWTYTGLIIFTISLIINQVLLDEYIEAFKHK